ncbi:hypothetical protein LXL04_028926 [Taraxacum kok-saghyz]
MFNAKQECGVEDEKKASNNIFNNINWNPHAMCCICVDFEDFYWEDSGQKDVDNESDNDEEDYNFMCTIINSPRGQNTFWLPKVGKHAEIDKNSIFITLQEGLNAYYQYAKHAGFDTRLGSKKTKKGILQYKYVFCNRAGEAKKYNVDTSNGEKGKQQRKKPSHMSKYPSRICFKVLNDGSFRYGSNKLEELHNHELYTNTTLHMAKHRRQLYFFDMTLINQLSQKNIGACKAHHMIGDTDANILVELMNLRKENVCDFSFVHLLEDSELQVVFWADNVAKHNYNELSDIIQSCIYTVYNHKKSITLGGALLARETAEYYMWLLKSFLDAFRKQPVIVVTDQEAAVENVFKDSIHRLCMWHIEKKLQNGFFVHVDERVIYGTEFKKRLQRLIWNNCNDPIEFECKWNALIE